MEAMTAAQQAKLLGGVEALAYQKGTGMYNHKIADVLSLGLIEIGQPQDTMPGLGYMVHNKYHRAFRLTDGLWHTFRIADPVKAATRDAEMSGPMLP